MIRFQPWIVASCLALVAACSGSGRYIKGTEIEDSSSNREILTTVESYRRAVEERDAVKLVTLASPEYWDDAGTPNGTDDFGYDQLKEKLATRFKRAQSIRYSLRYVSVEMVRGGREARVDVLIDASYSLETPQGLVRLDKRDQNRFVLTRDGDRWLFISGM